MVLLYIIYILNMAKPIKETPVLRGKDAKRFLKKRESDKNKKISPEIIERMKRNHSFMRGLIVNF